MNFNVFKRVGVSSGLFLGVVLCLQLLQQYLFDIESNKILNTIIYTVLFFVIEYLFINFIRNCIKMSMDKNLYLLIELSVFFLSPFLVIQLLNFLLPATITALGVVLIIIITLAVNFNIQFNAEKVINK